MKFFWQVLIALGLGAKRNWHIFFAIIFGAIFGIFLRNIIPLEEGIIDIKHSHAVYQILYVIGQVFIRSIEMIVIPLVLSSLILGITSLGDSRQLGRLAGKVLFFFVFTTTIACMLGAFLAITLKPGEYVSSYISKMNVAKIETIAESTKQVQEQEHDLMSMFIEMIPANPIKSMANGDLIPIIIFAMVFGTALTMAGEAGKPIIAIFEGLFVVTMRVMDWVMILAVPGVFALTANTVAAIGPEIFTSLLPYMGTVILGLLIQIFIIFPILLRSFAKVNALTLYKNIIEAQMVAFGTASSNATLPVTISNCERNAGISNRISSFVLPLGTTMNLDGTAMFECIAVIFLAQAYHLPIDDPYKLFVLIVMGAIASIAAAGVPSSGLVTMSLILNALGIFTPEMIIQGMALIWMVDRILDMCRTTVNVTSDASVATMVAATEGELDYDVFNNQELTEEEV